MLSRGHQPGEVGHVHHQPGAHVIGDPAEGLEVELARIRRPARHDHLRPVLVRQPLDLLHVAEEVLPPHVIRDDFVELA